MATSLGDDETNVSLNNKESGDALKKECNEEQPPEVNEQPLVRDALTEQPLMTEDLMMMGCGTEIAYVHNDISTAKLLAKRIFVPTTTCLDPKELHSKHGWKIDRIMPGSKGWLILLRHDGEKTEIEIAVVREKNWFDDYLSIKPLLSKGYKIDRIVPGSEGWLMILRR